MSSDTSMKCQVCGGECGKTRYTINMCSLCRARKKEENEAKCRCPKCFKVFVRPSNMRAHLSKFHKEVEESSANPSSSDTAAGRTRTERKTRGGDLQVDDENEKTKRRKMEEQDGRSLDTVESGEAPTQEGNSEEHRNDTNELEKEEDLQEEVDPEPFEQQEEEGNDYDNPIPPSPQKETRGTIKVKVEQKPSTFHRPIPMRVGDEGVKIKREEPEENEQFPQDVDEYVAPFEQFPFVSVPDIPNDLDDEYEEPHVLEEPAQQNENFNNFEVNIKVEQNVPIPPQEVPNVEENDFEPEDQILEMDRDLGEEQEVLKSSEPGTLEIQNPTLDLLAKMEQENVTKSKKKKLKRKAKKQKLETIQNESNDLQNSDKLEWDSAQVLEWAENFVKNPAHLDFLKNEQFLGVAIENICKSETDWKTLGIPYNLYSQLKHYWKFEK